MTDSAFGMALPLPVASAEFLDRLARRRSAPAQALAAPGPSDIELDTIVGVGARTPDHGKLFPWRFVILGPESRAKLARQLLPLADRQPSPDKARAVLSKLTPAPVTILVISTPVLGRNIPAWEQQLSAGAVCMNIEHVANALGYSASWITDWYSYDHTAKALYGVGPDEQVAGFIHLGTLAEPPLERPRPDMPLKVERRP